MLLFFKNKKEWVPRRDTPKSNRRTHRQDKKNLTVNGFRRRKMSLTSSRFPGRFWYGGITRVFTVQLPWRTIEDAWVLSCVVSHDYFYYLKPRSVVTLPSVTIERKKVPLPRIRGLSSECYSLWRGRKERRHPSVQCAKTDFSIVLSRRSTGTLKKKKDKLVRWKVMESQE